MTLEQLHEILKQTSDMELLGRYDEAENLCDEVLSAITAVPEQTQAEREWMRVKASALSQRATISLGRGDYTVALQGYSQALSISESLSDLENMATATGNMGSVYQNLGEYALSVEYLTKALDTNNKIGSASGAATNNSNLAIVYHQMADYASSLEHFKTALQLHEQVSNKRGQANVTGNIGLVYDALTDYPRALEHFTKAYAMHEEMGNKEGMSATMNGMGFAFQNLGDYSRSLECLEKSLAIDELVGSKGGVANDYGNIGIVYHRLGNHAQALHYYTKARHLCEQLGMKVQLAGNVTNIGQLYLDLLEYPQALNQFKEALSLYENLGGTRGIAAVNGNLGTLYHRLHDFPAALEHLHASLRIDEEIGNKEGVIVNIINIGNVYADENFEGCDLKTAEKYFLQAISMSEQLGIHKSLYDSHHSIADIYARRNQWKKSAKHFKLFYEIQSTVQNEEAKTKSEQMEHRRAIEDSERDRQVKLARFQEQEKILHNILPSKIAQRIVDGEKTIAESFDNVSVFFSDIVDFTTLSHSISAEELVSTLNSVFSEFDSLARKHGLEKIKTIGDSYMAVCGAPEANENHAVCVAGFALDVLSSVRQMVTPSGYPIELRIGLHCGNVVAGVIGENKFAYDMWGDTVNVASRMESHGQPGRIHVSEEFAALLNIQNEANELGPTFNLQDRGELEIKGKGVMRTYFLMPFPN